MIDPSVALTASNVPPGLNPAPADPHTWPPTRNCPEPSVDRLTDATSKRGAAADGGGTDWARIGVTTTIVPIPARTVFWAALSFATARLVMMCLILFFTFEPLTPETHTNGDST